MARVLSFVVVAWMLILILAACGGGGTSTPPSPQDAHVLPDGEVIRWDTSPSHIIFRADITSQNDSEDFFARTAFPACTIYGDSRVVWTTESENPLDSVLVGPVDEARIRSLVSYLTYEGIYDAITLADLQPQTISPIVQTLMLNVNGLDHISDLYGGWNEAFYERALEMCRTLSPRPQIFRPQALWIRVMEQEYQTNNPSILWDATVTGIDLAAVADSGQPRWIEGRVVQLFWAYRMRSPMNLQYVQDGQTFVVALEIPNVTRFSPPAP
jgi:hypothetical protein